MTLPDIYIAGMFDARERLAVERDRIHALKVGHVISLWLDEETAAPAIGAHATSTITPAQAKEYAERDRWEIAASDLLILDTFDDNLRGGREVEFGIALALDIEVWVVGPKRNVFHELALHFESWPAVLEQLMKSKSEMSEPTHTPTTKKEINTVPESRGVQSEKFLKDAARGPRLGLPSSAAARKLAPIASGVLDYFPAALAAVAAVSLQGNQQHNPGQPLHWAREKSQDHADCIARHLIERGSADVDGTWHSAKLAWRALALLQTELEEKAARGVTEADAKERALRKHFHEGGEQTGIASHYEPVQVGRASHLMPTPSEVLKRIKAMESA